MYRDGVDFESRENRLAHVVQQRQGLDEDVRLARDLVAVNAMLRAAINAMHGCPDRYAVAGTTVFATEPTVTPEQTLREAGIDDARQAAYQRGMSTLLAGSSAQGVWCQSPPQRGAA